jgi:peptidoglycan/LPS O-acetylase OafA/YrhL
MTAGSVQEERCRSATSVLTTIADVTAELAGRIRYVPGLDGLRGIAVAGVLLFHGGHLQGGYLGVDLVFVLSGYLITSLLLAECEHSGRVALKAFWARRARRLLPALAVTLLGVALYATIVAQPTELHQIRIDALATIAYIANWRFVFEHFSYWSLFTAPSPLQHTWSLAIEEQFYVVWPIVVAAVAWAVRRRGGRTTAYPLLILSTVLAVASAGWAVVMYQAAGDNRVYYGTDTRAAAILLGAALAALVAVRGPARTRRGRVAVEVTGVAGIFLLGVAWFRLSGTSPVLYQGGLIACSLAAVAVIAAVSHPTRGPLARVCQASPLVLLGMISYGVYLYHWPVFLWLNRSTGLRGWDLFLAQVAITMAVSAVSYVAVENPIRRGVLRRPRALVVLPATTVVVVASLVAVTAGYVPVSATVTRPDSMRAVTSSVKDGPVAEARLLLVGNSVPFFLAREGFERLTTEPPTVVLNGAFPICAFPSDATAYRLNQSDGNRYLPLTVPCNQGWSTAVERFRPNVVLFTMGDLLGELHDGSNGQWLRPCTAAFDSWFESSLLDAVRLLGSEGAHVVIATSAYSQYYGVPVNRWPQTDCMNRVERQVGAMDARVVSVIDLGHYVCPSFGYCRQTINGVPMRPDGIHYRGGSALAIAAWMLPQLRLSPAGGQRVTLTSRRATATIR